MNQTNKTQSHSTITNSFDILSKTNVNFQPKTKEIDFLRAAIFRERVQANAQIKSDWVVLRRESQHNLACVFSHCVLFYSY